MYQNASRCVIGLVSQLRPQEKSPWKWLTFKGFGMLLRCVRDSNPWPHAWQACILTNWTNAPLFHFIIAISLDCGCKGRYFFGICNTCDEYFFDVILLWLSYILILRRLYEWKKLLFNDCLEIRFQEVLMLAGKSILGENETFWGIF